MATQVHARITVSTLMLRPQSSAIGYGVAQRDRCKGYREWIIQKLYRIIARPYSGLSVKPAQIKSQPPRPVTEDAISDADERIG